MHIVHDSFQPGGLKPVEKRSLTSSSVGVPTDILSSNSKSFQLAIAFFETPILIGGLVRSIISSHVSEIFLHFTVTDNSRTMVVSLCECTSAYYLWTWHLQDTRHTPELCLFLKCFFIKAVCGIYTTLYLFDKIISQFRNYFLYLS